MHRHNVLNVQAPRAICPPFLPPWRPSPPDFHMIRRRQFLPIAGHWPNTPLPIRCRSHRQTCLTKCPSLTKQFPWPRFRGPLRVYCFCSALSSDGSDSVIEENTIIAAAFHATSASGRTVSSTIAFTLSGWPGSTSNHQRGRELDQSSRSDDLAAPQAHAVSCSTRPACRTVPTGRARGALPRHDQVRPRLESGPGYPAPLSQCPGSTDASSDAS